MSRAREDRITLSAVKLKPRIGVTAGERRMPQECEADVTVMGDFEVAASTDLLDRAINYSSVLDTVLKTAHEQEFNLIETLAYRIARTVLQSYPARRVNVRVRKRPARLVDRVDHIEVEIDES
jgi:7,8-dihydroneopterin aldolase/epimerase/oxygenase